MLRITYQHTCIEQYGSTGWTLQFGVLSLPEIQPLTEKVFLIKKKHIYIYWDTMNNISSKIEIVHPLTNYFWNNNKANSDILTFKEIACGKTHGINNFDCIKLPKNCKIFPWGNIGSFILSRFGRKLFLHCPWETERLQKMKPASQCTFMLSDITYLTRLCTSCVACKIEWVGISSGNLPY